MPIQRGMTESNRCPRCNGLALADYGETYCITCGTIKTTPRPWDRTALDKADFLDSRIDERRYRGMSHTFVPWTPAERRAFREWKEGDPIPEELK